jgi:hypothetical protein
MKLLEFILLSTRDLHALIRSAQCQRLNFNRVVERCFRRTGAPYSRDMPTWLSLIRATILCNKAEFRSGQGSVPVMKR